MKVHELRPGSSLIGVFKFPIALWTSKGGRKKPAHRGEPPHHLCASANTNPVSAVGGKDLNGEQSLQRVALGPNMAREPV